eukprot:c10194_g1_i1.p1 GENE.c10194_g1_i1~~c10194_g1_i1.p1  ORF type:complete len:305 (+),score=118.72 c10194_g1_i1:269-1183(+)
MIIDDHEIRDNWGTKPEDYDKESVHYFIGLCAYRVYKEYQAVLSSDVDMSNFISHKDHLLIPSFMETPVPIGLIITEQRGKTFRQANWPFGKNRIPLPLFGEQQWRDIIEGLRPGGSFDKVHVLLIVLPVPVALLGDRGILVVQYGLNVNDVESFLNHPTNIIEFRKLFNLLKNWKTAVPGREIVILAGDSHMGAVTKFDFHGKYLFHQLIASPVSNKPAPIYGAIGVILSSAFDQLYGGYGFSNRKLTMRQNYGAVSISKKKITLQLRTNVKGPIYLLASSLVKSKSFTLRALKPNEKKNPTN